MWTFPKTTEERLEEALRAPRAVDTERLQVIVTDGIAALSGEVPSRHQKRLLEMIAARVHGVRTVSGEDLRVADAPLPGEPSEDPLSLAVYEAFDRQPGLRDDPIEVVDRDRGVALRGAVDTEEEFRRAIDVARDVGAEEVDADGLEVVEGIREQVRRDGEGRAV